MTWRDRLDRILRQSSRPPRAADREEVARFLAETVAPALEEVADELRRAGRTVEVDARPEQVSRPRMP